MKIAILIVLMLFSFSVVFAHEVDNVEWRDPVLVADQLYYWEDDAQNLGVAITGKFNSRKKMAETLDLLQIVGLFQGRAWALADILVTVDLNGNGDVASWEISGPKPLLMSYVKALKVKHEDGSLFYDFGHSFINFKPSAFWEQELR